MTKAFISYHHANDQAYKEHLSWMAEMDAFEDISVQIGDIDENLGSQRIREIIRDDYLRDSEVTILLCGPETRFRKHVDWELKSSMIDGKLNQRSGILVIDLPSSSNTGWHASLPNEKEMVYSDYVGGWTSLEHKSEYEQKYPDIPERIIDNLINPHARLSIVPWDRATRDIETLKFLIDGTAVAGWSNQYDLALPMRMRNHNPTSTRRIAS